MPGDGRYEWDGFLDPDLLPVERDPERGWIATANAENLPRGYPYRRRKIGFEWAAPFRLQRIQSVLRRQRTGRSATRGACRSTTARAGGARVPLLAGLEPRRTAGRPARSGCCGAGTACSRPIPRAAALFEVWNSVELPTAVLRAALGSQKAVDAMWPGDPT